MKSILVAIDHTESARNARLQAIELSRHYQAQLTGLAILDAAAFIRPEPVGIYGSSAKMERDQALLERERQYLAQALAEFEEACRASRIEPRLLSLEGRQLQLLERESARHDLFILGRDTKFDPFYTEEGNVSKTVARLLRDRPRPLIVTSPEPPRGDGLLVIYDGRPPSDRLLQILTATGLHEGWQVEILGLGHDPKEADQNARLAREYLEDHGALAGTVLLGQSERNERVILNAIHEFKARIVAVATGLDRGWRRLLHGPAERHLLKKCSSALLLYR